MASRGKTNTGGAKRKPAAKKAPARRAPAKKSDLDRRWSLLLFGLGLFFVVLALVPGESGWAWLRENVLFGAFGISAWILGPMLIYWAVLIGLEKPVFPPVIKGILFMLALCGVALVFSRVDFTGLSFGEVMAALHESGRSGAFGGGLLSMFFGASLLALTGTVAARILLVLIFAVAVMVLTGVVPADIVRFFQRIGDSLSERMYRDDDDGGEPAPAPVAASIQAGKTAVPPTAKTNPKMPDVDIPLAGGPPRPVRRANDKMWQVDIPLDEPLKPVPDERVVQPVQATPPRRGSVDIPLFGEGDMFRDTRVDIDLGKTGPVSVPGKGAAAPVDIGPGGTFGLTALEQDKLHDQNPKLAAAQPAEEGFGLGEDYIPLVPFGPGSPVDATKKEEPGRDMLLFGEHDPYVNLGGAGSKLPPGTLLDAEYIPTTGAPESLFADAPAPPAPLADAVAPIAPAPSPAFEAAPEPGLAAQPPTPVEAPAAPPQPVPVEEIPFDIDPPQNAPVQAAFPTPVPQPQDSPADPHVDALIEKAATVKDDRSLGDNRGQDFYFQPYDYPPLGLFEVGAAENVEGVREEMKRTADLLVSTLQSFGVETRILDVSRGPSVTRYEVQPQAGVKISRITNLSDDIALNLAAAGVRIEAPIPGKPAVGIEVPNKVKTSVPIRAILESNTFKDSSTPLPLALGKDIAGDVVVADLTKMPHLLIAGSTGSGKSVCINSIIMSFLFKSSPEEVRLILIDPKVVELAEYNGIPHLLIPVVTEPKQAAKALGYAVNEMEKRYRMFAEQGVRDIKTYNKLARTSGQMEPIPHIAIVIDELADLMMVAGKDVENFICRIAQKARAAGMHLIVATQRPSVDVITGLIKSNIPSRIAFAVSSQVDSRTILDGIGAEKLLGMGDMLFMPIGANKPVRVQGTFVKDKEISRVLDYVKEHSNAQYDDDVLSEMERVALTSSKKDAADAEDGEDAIDINDETFRKAVETAFENNGQISTSFLQRRLRLGYARAGRIMDQMERMGIISEPDGSKPRQVLISMQSWQEMQMNASD